MLEPSYNLSLVLASIAVSLMASFTGLSLTKGIGRLPDWQRKVSIAMASVAIGGGIWSMHFVAMLAMEWPVLMVYDTLRTLASVLIAVLLAGTALLLMHFGTRSGRNIAIAGAILGNGIVAMHYVGMSAMQGCIVDFSWAGKAITILIATLMGIVAIWVTYSERSHRSILLGTLLFGLSVVAVHFTALYWTSFHLLPTPIQPTATIADGQLAIIVLLSAFLICGTFLLSATTFFRPEETKPSDVDFQADPEEESEAQGSPILRLPYERENRTLFIQSDRVAAIRAEGHYTVLYSEDVRLFCPWSISTVEKRLRDENFHRAHRSYLINIAHVTGFERRKDNGAVFFENTPSLKTVPVSRSRVAELKAVLGV